jgi:thymidylate kinase
MVKKKKVKFLVIDGGDCLGKSTQLNQLIKHFKDMGKNIHLTKQLGGDGTDDYQNALRAILIHDKFPKNNIELEETLFSLADTECAKMAENFMDNNENAMVIRDRGLASHVIYAMAKNMPLEKISHFHADAIQYERSFNAKYGVLNLILVAKDPMLGMKRIQKRVQMEGIKIVERLENAETQARVMDGMRWFKDSTFAQGTNVEVIEIEESDSIMDVKAKIMAVVDRYEF